MTSHRAHENLQTYMHLGIAAYSSLADGIIFFKDLTEEILCATSTLGSCLQNVWTKVEKLCRNKAIGLYLVSSVECNEKFVSVDFKVTIALQLDLKTRSSLQW